MVFPPGDSSEPYGRAHDPRPDDERLDGIVLAALGEPIDPGTARHLAECGECAAQRRRLEHTVHLARQDVHPLPTPDVRPPESVWAAIAAELGFDPSAPGASGNSAAGTRTRTATAAATAAAAAAAAAAANIPRPSDAESTLAAVPSRPAHRPVRASRRDATRRGPARRGPASRGPARPGARWALAAVALLAVIGTAAGGYAAGRKHAAPVAVACPTTRAELERMPDGPSDVGGQAQLVCSADGPALRVSTTRLPLRSGFYEVWLYNPTSGLMVAIGTLGESGSGSFTLPGGVNLDDYHVVDVSAQHYDGDPAHEVSVLRGPLTS